MAYLLDKGYTRNIHCSSGINLLITLPAGTWIR